MTYFDCYCDYEPPEFCRVKTQAARKEWRCEECSGWILPGESYEYTFGKWEGETYEARICQHCVGIRSFVTISVPCFCWTYGAMLEDAKTAIEEAYSRARDEVAGLFAGYARRVIALRRHNRLRYQERLAGSQ